MLLLLEFRQAISNRKGGHHMLPYLPCDDSRPVVEIESNRTACSVLFLYCDK